jgi:hypothetical protein
LIAIAEGMVGDVTGGSKCSSISWDDGVVTNFQERLLIRASKFGTRKSWYMKMRKL